MGLVRPINITLMILLGVTLSGCEHWDGDLTFVENQPSPSPTTSSPPSYTHYNDVGSGTPGDPYQLYDAAQFQDLASPLNYAALADDFVVENNVDFSGASLVLGNGVHPFTGVFDGGGNTLSSIMVTGAAASTGIFPSVNGGTIKNTQFSNVSVSGVSQVGVIGVMNTGAITNVSVIASTITGTGNEIGGLVGNGLANISECWTNGVTVSGVSNVGGLAGENGSNLRNSFANSVTVTGTGTNVGGLVGDNAGGTIQDDYAIGSAASISSAVGGLVGINSGTITDSFAGVNVSGSASADYLNGTRAGTISGSTYISGSACAPAGVCSSTPYSSNVASFYWSSTNLPTFSTTYWIFSGTAFPTL